MYGSLHRVGVVRDFQRFHFPFIVYQLARAAADFFVVGRVTAGGDFACTAHTAATCVWSLVVQPACVGVKDFLVVPCDD